MAKKSSYELALKNLEDAVERLESGELSLDEALTLFKAAVKHVAHCRQALERAELEIETLRKLDDGTFVRETFDD